MSEKSPLRLAVEASAYAATSERAWELRDSPENLETWEAWKREADKRWAAYDAFPWPSASNK